ncbi:MAG: hypothetical protein Q7S57_04880 [bacterium]|nr:hypothetical protein [bacterium]
MSNHKHGDSSSPMMWLMMLCCLFPLLVLIPGAGQWLSRWYLWPIFIGGFLVLHFWMHKKHSAPKNDQENSDTKDDSDSKHNSSCH